MSRRQRKVSDELRGIGSIYSDGDNLGRARYKITVYQEYIVDRDGPIPTLKDIKGTISLSQSMSLQLGKKYILDLEDGRQWTFWPKSGNPVSNQYDCVNAGPGGIRAPEQEGD